MSLKQLNTLYKFEKDKEHQAATALQQAEAEYQQNISRLQNVSDYRLEYMKRLSERSKIGIDSATYTHFHAFVQKLDYASEQVEIALKQAKALVEQRKQQWLAQQQKVQAVELLREKLIAKERCKADKLEQKMFDEIATQQFVRRKLTR
ncbi:flagellar export protein FliJ [Thalassotalea sp. LPB0316]|uniref:flagellar export protein FliJ n=1 Tax=Thalassotalea sp. LPB0316 TaxID=2769490 RepID=UPI0018678652|nr:flagellar export protein FliJ [Thalassotalea sp. LPB0316]QOL27093.1 flagellar export protein FliJ [Thalassotalea sp. LPB0316]